MNKLAIFPIVLICRDNIKAETRATVDNEIYEIPYKTFRANE